MPSSSGFKLFFRTVHDTYWELPLVKICGGLQAPLKNSLSTACCSYQSSPVMYSSKSSGFYGTIFDPAGLTCSDVWYPEKLKEQNSHVLNWIWSCLSYLFWLTFSKQVKYANDWMFEIWLRALFWTGNSL